MQEPASLIALYNEEGTLTGSKLYVAIDKRCDLVKIANILLFRNDETEIFITHPKSTLWPGRCTSACAGMNRYNESMERTAARTLQRELQLELPLTFIDERFYNFDGIRRHMAVYLASTRSRRMRLNPADVAGHFWISMRELRSLKERGSCAPTLEEALNRYKEYRARATE